jgi:hypothetical protein
MKTLSRMIYERLLLWEGLNAAFVALLGGI